MPSFNSRTNRDNELEAIAQLIETLNLSETLNERFEFANYFDDEESVQTTSEEEEEEEEFRPRNPTRVPSPPPFSRFRSDLSREGNTNIGLLSERYENHYTDDEEESESEREEESEEDDNNDNNDREEDQYDVERSFANDLSYLYLRFLRNIDRNITILPTRNSEETDRESNIDPEISELIRRILSFRRPQAALVTSDSQTTGSQPYSDSNNLLVVTNAEYLNDQSNNESDDNNTSGNTSTNRSRTSLSQLSSQLIHTAIIEERNEHTNGEEEDDDDGNSKSTDDNTSILRTKDQLSLKKRCKDILKDGYIRWILNPENPKISNKPHLNFYTIKSLIDTEEGTENKCNANMESLWLRYGCSFEKRDPLTDEPVYAVQIIQTENKEITGIINGEYWKGEIIETSIPVLLDLDNITWVIWKSRLETKTSGRRTNTNTNRSSNQSNSNDYNTNDIDPYGYNFDDAFSRFGRRSTLMESVVRLPGYWELRSDPTSSEDVGSIIMGVTEETGEIIMFDCSRRIDDTNNSVSSHWPNHRDFFIQLFERSGHVPHEGCIVSSTRDSLIMTGTNIRFLNPTKATMLGYVPSIVFA